MNLLDDARELAAELGALRRALHREPEIGLDLPRTQERVLDALSALPLEISTGQRLSSVTAVLRGTLPDRSTTPGTVLLRADMDALPVQEEADVEFRSRIDGAMHACGHDLHTAMLVGAAKLLAFHRDRLPGDVVFMFQPGEEAHDGAARMIDEGVLDAAGRRADAAYGLHVFASDFETNRFCSRRGAMMAAADGLTVTVHGPGGHGSAPHLTRDPVTAIAEMITSLQTMVTRRFSVFDPVVVGIGSLHAGAAANVVPHQARFEASVRTWSDASRAQFRELAPRLLCSIAEAHDVRVDVEFIDGYPVTVTTDAETDFAADAIAEVFGEDSFTHLANPLSGSEDFALVLRQVPGTFVGLGATPRDIDPAKAAFNHSPQARYCDSVLPSGAALYAELAARKLDVLTRKVAA